MAKTDYLGEVGLIRLIELIKQYVDETALIDLDIIKIVDVLPAVGEENKIYLVPAETTEEQNLFAEYIWVNNAWEKVGEVNVKVDLDGFVNDVTASGSGPLTLTATISGNTLVLSASMAAASSTSDGYMSAADKTKLDEIDTSGLVKEVSADGTGPLTLTATFENGAISISGSLTAASATSDGYMSSTQYTQLESLVENPLQFAKEISAGDVDEMWEEE